MRDPNRAQRAGTRILWVYFVLVYGGFLAIAAAVFWAVRWFGGMEHGDITPTGR